MEMNKNTVVYACAEWWLMLCLRYVNINYKLKLNYKKFEKSGGQGRWEVSSVEDGTGALWPRAAYPDSKWKLGQRWALSCNFRWANVGCAMQNHRHFAHPKNVGPTCFTNVGPTCCTNVGPTCSRNVGPTCCINVGPTCWANVGSLLVRGSC